MVKSKYIRVNGTLYKRAHDPIDVLDSELLRNAWYQSREYTEFLPDIVAHYNDDPEGLGEKLRDKFSMWVTENLLAPVEESIDWLAEGRRLARRDR